MKKTALFIGILTTLSILLSCNANIPDNSTPPPTKSQEMTITVETMKQVLDAFNRHDLDDIM